MIPRLIGAFKGDVATYEEIEHDQSATVQAGIVVLIAAVLNGLGGGFTNSIIGGESSFISVFFLGVAAAIISWLAWSFIVHFVGSKLFGADSTFGEMLRVIGFANVATWLAVIPLIGAFSVLWYLFVAFKAIRAGLDLPTGQTLIVIVIGLIIRVILRLILA